MDFHLTTNVHWLQWMANCVGLGNYRHFFLMITYLWLGSTYSVRPPAPCLNPLPVSFLSRDNPWCVLRAESSAATCSASGSLAGHCLAGSAQFRNLVQDCDGSYIAFVNTAER